MTQNSLIVAFSYLVYFLSLLMSYPCIFTLLSSYHSSSYLPWSFHSIKSSTPLKFSLIYHPFVWHLCMLLGFFLLGSCQWNKTIFFNDGFMNLIDHGKAWSHVVLSDSKIWIFISTFDAKSIKLLAIERLWSLCSRIFVEVSSHFMTSKWGINIDWMEMSSTLFLISIFCSSANLPCSNNNLL